MSDAIATEIAPAKPRRPSRKTIKRDERIRGVTRELKKDAKFLKKPRYAQQLRIYAGLAIQYETLYANIHERYGDNLLDELGHAIPALETLQRLGKVCVSIGNQLGLAPGHERTMRHGSGIDPDSPWLWLANHKDDEEVVVTPSPSPAASASAPASAPASAAAPASTAPEPAAANGTPASDRAVQADVDGTSMPGFTAPA